MNANRALLPAVLILASCHAPHGAHAVLRHVVYLPDATASIEPAAFNQAMHAIVAVAEQLRRGDCISVIPIISDSTTTPEDQIVRMCVPTERQPYDQDIQDFRTNIAKALAEQARQLSDRRSIKTDILGALKMADQEFALDSPDVWKTLFIFSDFLQEDSFYDFTRSPDLASPESAERLAQSLASGSIAGCSKAGNLAHVNVFLGNLPSTELPRLPPQRQAAIQQFWIAYLSACKAKPFFAIDGPGMSSRFLSPGN